MAPSTHNDVETDQVLSNDLANVNQIEGDKSVEMATRPLPQPVYTIPPKLDEKLRPFQREGVEFMLKAFSANTGVRTS